MKEFRRVGLWWLPGQEDKALGGTLSYHPDEGAKLELIGALKKVDNATDASQFDTILGVAEGDQITLHQCIETRYSFGMPGAQLHTFNIGMVLVGRHFHSADDIAFEELGLDFLYLQDWVGISGVKTWIVDRTPHVEYKYPTTIPGFAPNVSLALVFNVNTSRETLYDIKVQQGVRFKLKSEVPLPYTTWTDSYLGPLQNFLTLATGRINVPISVTGRVHTAQAAERTVQILFQLSSFRDKPKKNLHPGRIVFTYGDIHDRFVDVLERWFNVTSNLHTVCDLFFGVQFDPDMYIHQKLLSLAQGLESFHRLTGDNTTFPPEEHEKQLAAILESCPEDSKQWLAQKLQFSNEPSLRKRLKDLFARVGDSVSLLIPKQKTFVNLFVVTRNYLTHLDPSSHDQAVHGLELFKLVQQSHYLLLACLLSECGFSTDTIKQVLERNEYYQWAVNLCKSE